MQNIKVDKTLRHKDVSQINMYDLSLGLVSRETDRISDIKHLTNMKNTK